MLYFVEIFGPSTTQSGPGAEEQDFPIILRGFVEAKDEQEARRSLGLKDEGVFTPIIALLTATTVAEAISAQKKLEVEKSGGKDSYRSFCSSI